MGRDAILLQPSLRDSIMFHDVPRTTSWAKLNRPCGTESKFAVLTHSAVPAGLSLEMKF